jgi:hypothetical protein
MQGVAFDVHAFLGSAIDPLARNARAAENAGAHRASYIRNTDGIAADL